MRRAWVVAFLFVFACVTSAPASELPHEQPKPPLDPWSWLPKDSTFVGKLSLTELRKTQLWPLWAEVEQEQHIDVWVPLDQVGRVTFGGTGQSADDASYVAVLEGDFAQQALATLAQQDDTPRERHGILTFYRRPDALWTQLDPKLIVVCTPDRVMQVADRALAGPGAPVKDAPLYQALAERVALSVAHVALLAEDPEGKGRAMIDRRAAQYGLSQFTEDAKRLGLSIEITADYRVVAVSEAADEPSANELETATRDKLEVVANNMFVRMLGLGGMVSRMRVSRDANYVFVRGSVPEVDFNEAVERLHRMMSVAKGTAPSEAAE